jgi:hypothetical protein
LNNGQAEGLAMTRRGLEVARQRDNFLPLFSSQEEAERVLFQLRDDSRNEIRQLARQSNIQLDFSAESLKSLERWYFELRRTDGFTQLGVTQEKFERCMGFYTSFVYTENDPQFKWIVEESYLVKGRFEIGVTKGLMTVMVSHHSHAPELKNNKRMQSIYREYKKLAAR